jgi:AraC-like DNA-binding protein
VQNTLFIRKQYAAQPLQRFVGDTATILNSECIVVNRHVQADVYSVSFAGVPEEKACLYLFPIDTGKYCLQLLYLRHDEAAANLAVVYNVTYLPGYFDQFEAGILMANRPFRFDRQTEQEFAPCHTAHQLLDQLFKLDVANKFIQALQLAETTTQLLRRALQSIAVPFAACQVPACRFLAMDSEREKIYEARTYIEDNLTQLFTIRELSRKVAMNECYLKKGFKTLVGKTIHEYQQFLRIEKAKHLLQEEGRSVTDVADTLGYSSISHFSTAFKKATGMKPCELLR